MDTEHILKNYLSILPNKNDNANFQNLNSSNFINNNPFQNMIANPYLNPFLIQNLTDSILIDMNK